MDDVVDQTGQLVGCIAVVAGLLIALAWVTTHLLDSGDHHQRR